MKFELVKQDFGMRLANIGGLDTDSDDNLYVCVRGGDTPIVVFDDNGRWIGQYGQGLGVRNPHCVHLDDEDNIWLIDCDRSVVYKLSRSGDVLLTLGTPDHPSDTGIINGDHRTIRYPGPPFNAPTRLDIDGQGRIFVSDGYNNCRVHCFSPEGELLYSFGQPGKDDGAFQIVHSLCIDRENGDIYVADRENRRVQVFTAEGKLKAVWRDFHRPTDVEIYGGLVYVSELGETLFTDNVDYDYHTQRHHSQVRICTKDGVQVGSIGTADIGAPGNFFAAHCLCVNSKGDVYVGEVNNWDTYSIFTAWPGGVGMPTDRHCGVQRFRRKP